MIDIDDIYDAIHEYPLLVLWMERRRTIASMQAFAKGLGQELSRRVFVREFGDDILGSTDSAEQVIGYDRRYFLEPASGPTKRVAQWKQEQRRYRK